MGGKYGRALLRKMIEFMAPPRSVKRGSRGGTQGR